MAGNPNSCLIKIGNQKFRSLVDSGAEVSLLNRRVFKSLKNPPKLKKKHINLQSVNGGALEIDGCANITIDIGGKKVDQLFYIVGDMNRNVILGRDWLIQNGVRLYFDLGCLRIGKTYVPLEEDIHISSLIRLNQDMVIKPMTMYVCRGKVNNFKSITSSNLHQVSSVKAGFIHAEPGLTIWDSIVKVNKAGKVPITIVNNTNRTFHVRKGCVIGKADPVLEECLITTQQVINRPDNDLSPDMTKDLKVPAQYKDIITQLITDNMDRFADKDSDLGHTDTVKMTIDTGDHKPIKIRPYKTPLKHREVIKDAVREMEDAGIISRSTSPWSFPVVVVNKKDGSKRFCIDLRKLNSISKSISRSLPVIDLILSLLHAKKAYTSLDMKSGYWQVLMDEKDKQKVSFSCEFGQFEFNRMPFGLQGAPAVFQELMSKVLQGLEHFAVAYLDDILIFSDSPEENIVHTQIVLDRLRQHGLKLKLSKCQFLQSETNYLGFVINEHGIKPDPQKVAAIRSLPPPQSVTDVRSYIGMCSFYRRFLPNFSEIAEPLIKLTKKYSKFKWNQECQRAFEYLKEGLTTIPLLAYPDPNKPYTLYTDASDTCIGAVLCQTCEEDDSLIPGVKDEKPIYFLSHKLSDSQVKWSTIMKEAFAIHYSLQKLNHYLHGAKFVIKTDHMPLKYLLESPMQNKQIQLWALGIAGYNCTVEYIRGRENTCADLLSRQPQGKGETHTKHIDPDIDTRTYEIGVINSSQFDPKTYASCEIEDSDLPEKEDLGMQEVDLVHEQAKDMEIKNLLEEIHTGKASAATQQKYIIIDDVLYYISDPDTEPTIRLYVPTHMRSKVVTQYHDKNGHMGIDKTFDAIRLKYFWPRLYKELYDYVSHCIPCQTRSLKKIKPPLQETDIPPYPFAKIALDISGPYPNTMSGNKYIASFIDLYSGWPECFAVPDKKAETMSYLLTQEIFPRHGAPLVLLTDNGSENVNRIMTETLQELNIGHITTSYYHPQSNARVERLHRTMHDVLAKLVKDDPTTWDMHLNQMAAAIRFNISESSKFSPFYLLYNRDVVLPIDNILKPRRKYHGEDSHQIALQQQHKSFTLVHRNLKKAKRRQAAYADRNAQHVEFQVGDPVYYKKHRRNNKLEGKWQPYYRIIEKRGPVSFIIRNQLDGNTTKVHAEHLRLAKIDQWEIPKDTSQRPLRRAAYVVPPEEKSAESSDSEDEMPLDQLAKRLRRKRENSDDEDDIPLMELAQRLKERAQDQQQDADSSKEEDERLANKAAESEDTEEDMVVDEVKISPKIRNRSKKSEDKNKVKQLLQALINVM